MLDGELGFSWLRTGSCIPALIGLTGILESMTYKGKIHRQCTKYTDALMYLLRIQRTLLMPENVSDYVEHFTVP